MDFGGLAASQNENGGKDDDGNSERERGEAQSRGNCKGTKSDVGEPVAKHGLFFEDERNANEGSGK